MRMAKAIRFFLRGTNDNPVAKGLVVQGLL